MKLEKAIKEYILEITVKGYSKETIRVQKANLAQFMNFKGNVDLDDIDRLDIKEFIVYEQQVRKIKAKTINHYVMNLRTMFKFCVSEDICDHDPTKKIERMIEEKNIIKTYSPKEVQAFLDHFNGKSYIEVRNKTIVTMFVETGIRNSELCNIKLSDIYEDSIRIHGKGNKVRYVPISLPLKRQLLRYMRSRDKHFDVRKWDNIPQLFASRSRTSIDRYRTIQIIEKAGLAIGLEINPTVHHFRRFYAQLMLKNTDLYTVSRLLGHSDVKTTEIYIQGIEDKDIIQRGMKSPLTR